MENLDLDINNYNINDLEKFFRLKPNSKYTAADIELKEYQIREQLLNSGHINNRFKRDLIDFLEIAKTRSHSETLPAANLFDESLPQ
jgi:hypothetical protein